MRRLPSVAARHRRPKVPRLLNSYQTRLQVHFRTLTTTRNLADRTTTNPPAHEASTKLESSTETERHARIEAFHVRDKAILKRHGGARNAGYRIETWQNSNLQDGYKTRGWPVYRTCYENEDDWEIFKSRFRQLLLSPMQYHFDDKEVEERSKYLSFPFWEDREFFENATTTKLRAHYREYLLTDAPLKTHGISPPDLRKRPAGLIQYITCYEFFLVADAASISSVVQAPMTLSLRYKNAVHHWQNPPWINVVEVDWPPRPEPNEHPEDRWDSLQDCEPVEGMRMEDVRFHRCAIETMYPQHVSYLVRSSRSLSCVLCVSLCFVLQLHRGDF